MHQPQLLRGTPLPFDALPTEILSNILSLIFTSDTDDDSPSRFFFPSIPCQVSRFFNEAALSTPLLWTYIRVSSTTNLDHIKDRIERRSGVLPLHLHFQIDTKDILDHQETRTYLIQHSSRWGRLSIEYFGTEAPQRSDWCRPFLDLMAPATQQLRSVSVTAPEWFGHFCLLRFPRTMSPVPILELRNCGFRWSSILPPGLTRLSVAETIGMRASQPSQISKCLAGGSTSSSLVSLSIQGSLLVDYWTLLVESDGLVLPEPSILEVLEVLELDGLTLWEVAVFCAVIKTPRMRRLKLGNLSGGPNHTSQCVQLWNDMRFGHALEELDLIAMKYVFKGRLSHFLKTLPDSVNRLSIARHPEADGMILALSDLRSSRFLNQLESIAAEGYDHDEIAALVPRSQDLPLPNMNRPDTCIATSLESDPKSATCFHSPLDTLPLKAPVWQDHLDLLGEV